MDAESEIITSLEVLPGNGDEAADSEPLLRVEEEAQGNDVAALSTDGLLSARGEVLRTLEAPAGLGVVVYAPPPASTQAEGFFLPEPFPLDEKGEVLTCPAGHKTDLRYPNTHGTGWRFQFRRSQGRDCPLLGQCMAHLPAKHGRTVVK